MEGIFKRNLSIESNRPLPPIIMQKKLAENRRQTQHSNSRPENVPDLTDFMNDMFLYGTINASEKAYNLTGGGGSTVDDGEDSDDSTRSSSNNNSNNSSRLTQEWLQEAKRMVASSPSRSDSPSRLVGSPRFASSSQPRSSLSMPDRRDPLSRSARRHRTVESFSGEILTKSAKHNRNKSETLDQPPSAADISPASAVHKWFSNILKSPNTVHSSSSPLSQPNNDTTAQNPTAPPLPPRQLTPRKSRFQKNTNPPNATQQQPQGIPSHLSKRTFKTTTTADTPPDTQLLSPPKNLIESAHRRSISSSTCLLSDSLILSPPKNLVESAHRRSISSSTCIADKISWKPSVTEELKEHEVVDQAGNLNGFLKEQGIKIGKILNGEIDGKAKIVLSGPSNSTSSMVAAICYAWLLDNRMRTNKEGVEGDSGPTAVVAPVMNMRRGTMWKQRQVAWLFHHVGLDATSLLFSDEVDLETLMMAKQLSILVVGQDILKTNGEVGSQCTILTDNYCEDAYDILQTPILKKLLLAGILLDTQNLNTSDKLSMTRDAEAIQLLSVGSAPNYRNELYDQLMQDQRDVSFFEALRHNYGKPPNEGGRDCISPMEHKIQEKKSNHEAMTKNSDKNSNDVKSTRTMLSPNSAKPKAPTAATMQAAEASRGKNKFFLAKWFGFGPK
ncbi:hypothetical protein CsSME_00053121 [Camellia sinensis var. sinensis]